MKDVIKKTGKKEPFDLDKIRKSIKKSFVDAGISVTQNKEKIESIVKEMVNLLKIRLKLRQAQ